MILELLGCRQTIVPTQPLGAAFLGGKLLSLLCVSKDIADAWKKTYGDTLVGMTTTSLYGDTGKDGKTQYDGLTPYWKKMGQSKGTVPLKMTNAVYEKVQEWVRLCHPERYYQDAVRSRKDSKNKLQRFAYKELGLAEGSMSEHKRNIYFSRLYKNTDLYIQRYVQNQYDASIKRIDEQSLEPAFDNSIEALTEHWKFGYLKIEETDNLVWDTVVDVLERSHHFKEEIRTKVLGASLTHSDKQDKLKTFKRKLKSLDTAFADATNTVVNLETDALLKRRNATEVSSIMKNVEKYRMEIQSERETLRQQIYSIENQYRWVDWKSKFGDRINQMSEFSPEEKKNFLSGVIERIGVQTLDKQTHELHLKFRIPCVNDLLIWNNKTDKSKGYTIRDGVTDISVEIDSGKKSPKLRT